MPFGSDPESVPGQKKPATHVLHDDLPISSWYSPAPHGSGSALLPGHECPIVQMYSAGFSSHIPAGQKYEAPHADVSPAVIFSTGQKKPAVHGMQSEMFRFLSSPEKVPRGHGSGSVVPALQ